MGQLTSQSGVQQGDPLHGSFSVCIGFAKVAGAIKEDTECSQLLYQAWYLDDGILAGKKSSIRDSWLSVIPSTSQGLHLDPIEFRVAVKWWLGLDTS